MHVFLGICKKVFLYLTITLVIVAVALFAFFVILNMFLRPSLNRDWSLDNAIVPTAEFEGDMVTVRNVRNYSYRSVLDFDPKYEDRAYDLSKITSVDFFNEPFSGVAAHTFLSFGFENGEYMTISVEVRREKGEFFGAVKGLLNQFELLYVVADERDVVKLRTNYRRDNVYRYPIDISPARARALLVDMLQRANKLAVKPEFYNTLTNNCTTNIVEHVNRIADKDKRIGFSYRYVFPKYSDSLAYDLGFVKGGGTFQEVKTRGLITPAAQECGDCEDFSKKIRGI